MNTPSNLETLDEDPESDSSELIGDITQKFDPTSIEHLLEYEADLPPVQFRRLPLDISDISPYNETFRDVIRAIKEGDINKFKRYEELMILMYQITNNELEKRNIHFQVSIPTFDDLVVFLRKKVHGYSFSKSAIIFLIEDIVEGSFTKTKEGHIRIDDPKVIQFENYIIYEILSKQVKFIFETLQWEIELPSNPYKEM